MRLRYDPAGRTLASGEVVAPLTGADGPLALRVLQDRGSIEVFAQGGRSALSVAAVPTATDRQLRVSVTGGAARLRGLEIRDMTSSWSPADAR